ncbi:hypothetical protein RRG08_017501 [Elysia crispata]|uniref:Uncharacterized protein n=1 Tax=Elysia crispata TaxID=231223 RepID=A0AAE1AFG1_9GAST|nr:hypothetical protein RRG08_017501 [Elysia crispata]
METGAQHPLVTKDDETNLYSDGQHWRPSYLGAHHTVWIRKDYSIRSFLQDAQGDAAHTTSLTQQQLQDAHAKLYHPSNARISTFGHLPLESHMEFTDSSQVELSQIEPSVGEPHEPRWKKSLGALI